MDIAGKIGELKAFGRVAPCERGQMFFWPGFSPAATRASIKQNSFDMNQAPPWQGLNHNQPRIDSPIEYGA
jgi:hypothetical protein